MISTSTSSSSSTVRSAFATAFRLSHHPTRSSSFSLGFIKNNNYNAVSFSQSKITAAPAGYYRTLSSPSASNNILTSTAWENNDNRKYYPAFPRIQTIGMRSTSSSTSSNPSDPNNVNENKKRKETKSIVSSIYPSFDPSNYTLPSSPDILQDLPQGQRIVSFGDVHGDIFQLQNFLKVAKVMCPNSTIQKPKWIGGDTILVQCGDILDRGDEELQCLRLMTELARQAPQDQGRVIMLHGNHEALNAVGLFQYANKGGNLEFEQDLGKLIDQDWQSEKWRLQFAGNQPSRWAAFEPGGILSDSLLTKMKVSCIVGNNVFVHAGLTKAHLEEYNGSLEEMNKQASDWFQTKQHGDNNNLGLYKNIEEVVYAAESRAKAHSKSMPSCLGGGIGSPSPVWMRDYSQPNDREPSNVKNAQFMINEVLAYLNCERMVMGHTPQMRINCALQEKAWRVDVGASKGVMNGKPEVLEIIHSGSSDKEDEIYILTMNGERINGKERMIVDNILF